MNLKVTLDDTNMVHITHDRREKIEGKFERDVKWLLEHSFYNSGFFTISEVAKYKPAEDLSVWNQARGREKEIVEVYHKGEYLCDVDSSMNRDQVIRKVSFYLRAYLKKKQEEEIRKGGVKVNDTSSITTTS